MAGPYVSLIGFQSTVMRQWLRALFAAVDLYAVILDPRPDLAIPARRVRGAYQWWW